MNFSFIGGFLHRDDPAEAFDATAFGGGARRRWRGTTGASSQQPPVSLLCAATTEQSPSRVFSAATTNQYLCTSARVVLVLTAIFPYLEIEFETIAALEIHVGVEPTWV
jgi:hypothetical protein